MELFSHGIPTFAWILLEGGYTKGGRLNCKFFDEKLVPTIWGLVGRRRKPKNITNLLGFQRTTTTNQNTLLVGEEQRNCVEREKKTSFD
jgi:hypothetical protein